ncbi:hypothetical protein FJT64_001598 [Amphibalanus amphitrite]|uniref:Uncharacterized protein n=1 Tax=Amphibalanus amphitrite TaxID=1232801 RepID=A0A6A4XFG4_AMPAM|nr:hypothetical protein FJT64_001598 [Amphibalanus amphitrite]
MQLTPDLVPLIVGKLLGMDRRSTMVSLSFTSLTTLINREDLSAFTSFLNNRNVAVDDRDENGTTAMMVAAEKGHSAFIHALVEFGADATLSDLVSDLGEIRDLSVTCDLNVT